MLYYCAFTNLWNVFQFVSLYMRNMFSFVPWPVVGTESLGLLSFALKYDEELSIPHFKTVISKALKWQP